MSPAAFVTEGSCAGLAVALRDTSGTCDVSADDDDDDDEDDDDDDPALRSGEKE